MVSARSNESIFPQLNLKLGQTTRHGVVGPLSHGAWLACRLVANSFVRHASSSSAYISMILSCFLYARRPFKPCTQTSQFDSTRNQGPKSLQHRLCSICHEWRCTFDSEKTIMESITGTFSHLLPGASPVVSRPPVQEVTPELSGSSGSHTLPDVFPNISNKFSSLGYGPSDAHLSRLQPPTPSLEPASSTNIPQPQQLLSCIRCRERKVKVSV